MGTRLGRGFSQRWVYLVGGVDKEELLTLNW